LEKKRTKKNKEKKEAKKNEEELIKEARKQKTVTVVDGGSTVQNGYNYQTAVWDETGQVSGQGPN
jgi:predicted secreted protein